LGLVVFDAAITVGAGVVFGLALAAPPGPMNAIIAEESVHRGWVAGMKAGAGAGVADFIFFVLAAVGVVGFVQQFPTVQGVLFGAGGVLMCYFAYGAVESVQESFTPDQAPPDGAHDDSTGFRKAFVLALTNPYQILFWLTVGVGMLEPGRIDVLVRTPYVGDALANLLVVETGSPALVVGFFGGIACWLVCFPGALVSARKRVDAVAPTVAVASAVVLGGFGVLYLLKAVRMFG
jgi:threonine/homoserine/homoserine lactone efflux protein